MLYQEEPYRIFNAFIYFLGGFAANLTGTTFNTVNLSIQYYYSVSEIQVSLSSIIFLAVHPIMTFVSNFILNKRGFKFGCSLGAILVIIGMLVRLLIQINFAFIIIGNCIVGAGNIFFIISVTQHSALWFRPEVRWIITNVGLFCTHLTPVGAFVSPFVIKTHESKEVGRHQVFTLLSYQGIVVCAAMILNLIFLRDKPSKPPAPSVNKPREQYLPALKLLIRNKNYLMILFCTLFAIGGINSFGAIMQPFLHPFGFTSHDISYIIIISTVSSLLGVIILSTLIKKVKRIKFFILSEFVSTLALIIGLGISMYFQNKNCLWIFMGFFTFFLMAIVAQLLQIASDVVFPVGQSLSAGFIIASGQLVAFAVGLISALIVKGQNPMQSVYGLTLYFGMYVIGFIFLTFMTEDFRRKKYDQAGEQTNNLMDRTSRQSNKSTDTKLVVNNN